MARGEISRVPEKTVSEFIFFFGKEEGHKQLPGEMASPVILTHKRGNIFSGKRSGMTGNTAKRRDERDGPPLNGCDGGGGVIISCVSLCVCATKRTCQR